MSLLVIFLHFSACFVNTSHQSSFFLALPILMLSFLSSCLILPSVFSFSPSSSQVYFPFLLCPHLLPSCLIVSHLFLSFTISSFLLSFFLLPYRLFIDSLLNSSFLIIPLLLSYVSFLFSFLSASPKYLNV